jgi:hypothetical protein
MNNNSQFVIVRLIADTGGTAAHRYLRNLRCLVTARDGMLNIRPATSGSEYHLQRLPVGIRKAHSRVMVLT